MKNTNYKIPESALANYSHQLIETNIIRKRIVELFNVADQVGANFTFFQNLHGISNQTKRADAKINKVQLK
jgi:hypothetical protein